MFICAYNQNLLSKKLEQLFLSPPSPITDQGLQVQVLSQFQTQKFHLGNVLPPPPPAGHPKLICQNPSAACGT